MVLLTAHSKSEVVDAYDDARESRRVIGVHITPSSLSWVEYRTRTGVIAHLAYDPEEEMTP